MKKLCLPLFAAVALVLMLASCSSKPKYADMIPANTVAILRVDAKTLAEQSSESGNLLTQKLKDSFAKEEMSMETKEKVMKIIDNPAEAGVDLRDAVLLCMGTNVEKDITLLATLHDADKFEELLNLVAKESGQGQVKTKDQMKYLYTPSGMLAFNEDVLVVCPAMGGDQEQEAVANAEKILSGQNGADSKFVDKLLECDGALSVMVTGEVYNMQEEAKALMGQALPKDLNLKDVAILADLSMDRGEAVVDYETLTSSEAWEKYQKTYEEMCGKLDGDMAKSLSKDGFALFCHLDGAKLLEVIKNNPAVAQAGEEAMKMLESIYGSIDGDVAIGLDGYDPAMGIPSITAYMKTKDNGISTLLTTLAQGVVQTGYKDGYTYALTNKEAKPFDEAKNAFAKSDIAGKRAYVYFNFGLLRTIAVANGGSESQGMFVAAALFDVLEADYKGDGKGQVKLTLRDKTKYPIEAIAELLAKQP